MEQTMKRKIRSFWRDRVLISVGSLAVFIFSALQLQKVLEYRPVQPLWALELSQAVRIVTNDEKSDQDRKKAFAQLKSISHAHELKITTLLLKNLKWKYLNQELERAQDWRKTQELATAKAREIVLKRVQELEGLQEKQRSQNIEKKQKLLIEKKRALAMERALALALAFDKPVSEDLLLKRTDELLRILDPNRELDKILAQELQQLLPNDNLFVFIIASELEQIYGLKLQQGTALESILSNEPNRTNTLIQSSILLGTSLLTLIILLIILSKYDNTLDIPRTAHLIALLPEEYVAELDSFHDRLNHSNASIWSIKRRMMVESLTLIWTYYTQIQLDNLIITFRDNNESNH